MSEPSSTQRHPVVLKMLAVTMALGFLGTVMCTAGGSGSGASQSVAAQPAARDGGSVDAGGTAASTPEVAPPESERFFPATKAGPLDLGDREPRPRQAVPQQQAPQQEPRQQAEPR